MNKCNKCGYTNREETIADVLILISQIDNVRDLRDKLLRVTERLNRSRNLPALINKGIELLGGEENKKVQESSSEELKRRHRKRDEEIQKIMDERSRRKEGEGK